MSVESGPNIPKSGLILSYDMGNTTKSWLGAPTTNYIPFPAASWNGSAFVNFGYNYANLGATYTYSAGVSNPINAPGVLQYFTGTTGYKYFSIDSTTLPTTGTYTFSYYARIVGGTAPNNIGNSQLWRANGSDRAVTGNWNPTFTSQWVRYSTTGPAEAGTILQYFPIHSGAITGGYIIEYCGFQLELGSYATPFVEGTRSNTRTIVDLTGNNTLTATSLTYASDNTFSFDGSASNCLFNDINLGNGNLPWVANVWVKTTTAVNGTGLGAIISNWNSGPVYSSMGVNSGKIVYWTYQNAAWTQKLGVGKTVNDNVWHMLTWVNYNNFTMDMYVDGVLDSNVPNSTSGNNNPVNSIGRSWAGFFPGSISSTSVYNTSITAAQVAQLFNATRGRYGV